MIQRHQRSTMPLGSATVDAMATIRDADQRARKSCGLPQQHLHYQQPSSGIAHQAHLHHLVDLVPCLQRVLSSCMTHWPWTTNSSLHRAFSHSAPSYHLARNATISETFGQPPRVLHSEVQWLLQMHI